MAVHRVITQVLRDPLGKSTGFSRVPGQVHWFLQGAPYQSTQMCVNVATLRLPLIIISLATFMISHTNPRLQWHSKNPYNVGDKEVKAQTYLIALLGL